MKKASAKRSDDDLRPEYDLSQLKGGVRGKYYRQATAGANLILSGRQRGMPPKRTNRRAGR